MAAFSLAQWRGRFSQSTADARNLRYRAALVLLKRSIRCSRRQIRAKSRWVRNGLFDLSFAMKLSISAELVYTFAAATQIIANLEASETDDQTILSESLDFQPPAHLLS
jgi:hypothetical protein